MLSVSEATFSFLSPQARASVTAHARTHTDLGPVPRRASCWALAHTSQTRSPVQKHPRCKSTRCPSKKRRGVAALQRPSVVCINGRGCIIDYELQNWSLNENLLTKRSTNPSLLTVTKEDWQQDQETSTTTDERTCVYGICSFVGILCHFMCTAVDMRDRLTTSAHSTLKALHLLLPSSPSALPPSFLLSLPPSLSLPLLPTIRRSAGDWRGCFCRRDNDQEKLGDLRRGK